MLLLMSMLASCESPPTQTPDERTTGAAEVKAPDESVTKNEIDSSSPASANTEALPEMVTVEVRLAAGSDDAEESYSGGMYLDSSDLELVYDSNVDQGRQTVGMRFNGVGVPQGASIVNAHLQFQVDEPNSEATSLLIEGEDADDAATFTSANSDISPRPRTTAAVSWSPVPWTTVGQAGLDQRTPNIGPIIQEIVNRTGWSSGNSLAIIITGTGVRTVERYDGDPAGAPLLHVEYSTVPINQPPTATIHAPGDDAIFTEGDSIAFSGGASDTEDGNVTASLVWMSSIDGEIGTGGSFSRPDLSVGSHIISGTATDSDGLTGTDSIGITIFPGTAVLVGAGDIANCDSEKDEETATLLDNIAGTVFSAGDSVYPDGTDGTFTDCYDPTWGRHRARTRPTPGNHDYRVPGASGYFSYFGAAAGEADKGYYSYEIGDWHIIALNSECSEVGGCGIDSPQGEWLQADLAANPSTCTLAIWHKPRFSSGSHYGDDTAMQDFWQLLYDASADIVLNGHEHNYERFALQDPNGVADPERGIREFVVGTGGKDLYPFGTIQPNSEIRDSDTYGVLKLTLHPTSYDWEFIPIAGMTFTDSGSASCVAGPPTTTIRAPADGATFAAGEVLTFTGSASEAKDGDLTASLVRVSNIDAEIRTGAAFSGDDLSAGLHTLSGKVTDTGGWSGSDQASIAVTSPGANLPPVVSAGPDQTVGLLDDAVLDGTVTDDGLPDPPGVVTTTWTQQSGPGTVVFADASAEDTSASFSEAGGYVLELTADDGELTASDPLTVTVASGSIIEVPEDQPTIQAGIDAAQDGDWVLVSPGTYPETLILAGKTITLASQFLTTQDASLIEQTIIDGGGSTVVTVAKSVGPETKIIGFTIQNGEDGISPSGKLHILHNRFTGNVDAIDYEGGGGICRNNVFENNTDDAVDLDGPTEVVIENNTIRTSGDDGIEIRLQPYSGTTLEIIIRGNTISGSGEDGIQIIDYPEVSDRTFLIERNLIEASAMAGLGLMDNGVTREDYRAASIPEPIHLFNNTFVGSDHGLSGGDNLIALNNLFVGSTQIGVKGLDGDSVAAYNLFWDNGTDHQSSNVDLVTSLFTDPLLDAERQLPSDSPAVDAGTAHFEWQGEIVLDLHPGAYTGAAPDLGWFESDFWPSNQPPTVTISAPVDGSRFLIGESIGFGGTATDAEDGDLTADLTWISSLDGVIGTGGSFSRDDLATGVHPISATVTDSGGLTRSDQITIRITTAPIDKDVYLPIVMRHELH